MDDRITELEKKIKQLEERISELNKKLENHRHDGHGFTISS